MKPEIEIKLTPEEYNYLIFLLEHRPRNENVEFYNKIISYSQPVQKMPEKHQ